MRVYVQVVGVVLLCASGCWPTITYGPEVQLDCTVDDDCPADLVCATAVGRCAPAGATFDTTPPHVLTATASPAVSSSSIPSVVTITATEPLAQRPLVKRLRTRDGAVEAIELVVASNDDGSVSVTVAPDALDVSGAVEFEVQMVDVSGNTTTERAAPVLVFDLDGPALLDADVDIAANPTTNVLYPAAPAAARADSTVAVDVLLSEGATSATAALFAADDVDGVAAVTNLSLAVAVDDPRRVSITLPPELLETLTDGAYVVQLDATDAVGNVSTVVVDVPIEVDNEPPAAPQLATLVRAPWGSALVDEATHAVGTVDDAVLVLGVLAGTVVDPDVVGPPPPSVSRVAPVDGAFSFSFPVDIPDVGAVAVDRAGNLSAVALASTTQVHASVLATSSPHHVASRQVFLPQLLQRGDVDHTEALRDSDASIEAATWWERLTTTTSDTFSQFPLLAFEPREQVVLLVANGQTFKLVGHDLRATGAPPLPTLREGTLVTDEDRGVVVYFGGTRLDGSTTNELYEWNGTTWEQRLVNVPADQLPAPRAGHSMVWAPGQGLLIVNGCGEFAQVGVAGCTRSLPAETWRYDGTTMELLCRGNACGVTPAAFRPTLVVDGERRVLAFGGVSFGPVAVAPGRPTVSVFDRETGTWTGECAGSGCGNATVNAGAFVDDSGVVQLLSRCGADNCLRSYVDEQFVNERIITSPELTFLFNTAQQPAWLAVPGRGVFVGAITNGGSSGAVLKLDDDALRFYAPTSVAPRCGGAAVVDDDDVLVAAGCSTCTVALEAGGAGCTAIASSERIINDVVRPEDDGPSGFAFGVSLGAPVLVQQRADIVDTQIAIGVTSHRYNGVGWSAQSTAAIPVVAGQIGRVLGVAVDPADRSRALVLVAAGFFGEHPRTLDTLMAVHDNGVVDVACDLDCGTLDVGANLPAVAAASTFAVAFGGANFGRPTTTTAVARGAAFGPGPALTPDARLGARFAGDTERNVAWLVGGNVRFANPTGNDVFRCDGKNDENCSDVQVFDGTTWHEVEPVDVLGSGFPRSRVLTQMAWDGSLVIVGGAFAPTEFSYETLSDAWRLHTSSTTSPATLFTVELEAFGAGTSTTPSSIDVLWCGKALDAAREPADVALSVWNGMGFVRLTTRADDESVTAPGTTCVRGSSTNALNTLRFATQQQRLVVAVHVDAAPATGLGMPLLQTTVLEPVVVYQR